MTENDKKLLASVLWDTDLEKLDINEKYFAIIERVLKFGRPEQIRWLLMTYSENQIIETIKKSKNIDLKTANFWSIHYKIPREDIFCLNNQLTENYFH
jgi:hypothetical protein